MPQATVFIVEDESIVAEDLKATLTDLGYSIAGSARSGEEAVPAITKARPDIILMDIQLAGTMDGIETAGIVRDRMGIPVIFLTAHSDKKNIERAQDAGPYGYILKPFGDRELYSAIEIALSRHRLDVVTREKEQTVRALANAIPDPAMLVSREKKILAANDAMARRFSPAGCALPASLDKCPGSSPALLSRIDAAFTRPVPETFEENTGSRWYEVSLVPVPGNKNDPLLLVQYHDITLMKEFEAALRADGILQIEKDMEQFQVLNDEIRNPLQAILGYLSMDSHKYHDRIVEQVELINNLVRRLDRGWVESGKVHRFLIRHYREDMAGLSGAKAR